MNKGLYNKYHIEHSDGTPIDHNAEYFVLRYDKQDAHGLASRLALAIYAFYMQDKSDEKQLAIDLLARLEELGMKGI